MLLSATLRILRTKAYLVYFYLIKKSQQQLHFSELLLDVKEFNFYNDNKDDIEKLCKKCILHTQNRKRLFYLYSRKISRTPLQAASKSGRFSDILYWVGHLNGICMRSDYQEKRPDSSTDRRSKDG